MKRTFKTRLAALLCAAALLGSVSPGALAAAPVVAISSSAVTQGGTCTLTVTGKNLSDLTSLQLEIAYDKEVFTVMETVTQSMDVATADAATPGEIRYIGISMDGISGNQKLMDITFRASAGAQPGTYPVTLFVAGATADSATGDKHVVVSVQAGSLSVTESGQVAFSSSLSTSRIEAGDEVTMTISSSQLSNLAGGRFVFLYDDTLLAYKEMKLLPAATGSEHTYTVNTANEGRVAVSFVSDKAVQTGKLLQVTLVAKDNVSGTTQIRMEPEELTDQNANPLTANSTSCEVSVAAKARAWLALSENANTHEPFTVTFWVDGISGLAAGDFSIAYDTELLECLAVNSGYENGESASSGTYVVIDDAWGDGTVEFSVLQPNGIKTDTCLLSMKMRTKNSGATDVVLEPRAETTPVDPKENTITLKCDSLTAVIEEPDHTCLNGYCTDCEKDMAIITRTADSAMVSVPGVVDGGMLLIAFYDANGRMVQTVIIENSDEMPMSFPIPKKAEFTTTTVFVVGQQWQPLREPVRVK